MTQAAPQTMEDVVALYIQYRDAKAAMSEKHKAEMEPLTTAMDQIEAWFQAKMQAEGVDSIKTPAGTPYRQVSTSVKLEDAEGFKDYVLAPAADSIYAGLAAAGVSLQPEFKPYFLNLLKQHALWGMVDFRPLKTGVVEHIDAQHGELPPGISISTFEKVNFRRA